MVKDEGKTVNIHLRLSTFPFGPLRATREYWFVDPEADDGGVGCAEEAWYDGELEDRSALIVRGVWSWSVRCCFGC